METKFTEKILISMVKEKNSVYIDTRKDINYFETLCLYCADNNIDLKKVSNYDFLNASKKLEDSAKKLNYFYMSIA